MKLYLIESIAKTTFVKTYCFVKFVKLYYNIIYQVYKHIIKDLKRTINKKTRI